MADNRGGFYNAIYSALLDSAKRQGAANPEALARLGAAQSSLETGGGKHAPGNNYFGIKGKGGGSYSTNEVVNGKTITIKDSFRGYPSMQASADDYVKFLHQNPRYKNVIAARTPEEAIAAQARTGYATDPKYGQKLAAINSRGMGSSPQPSQENTQVASNRQIPQQQSRLADSPAFRQMQPATVAAKPASQQQIAQPNIQPPVKQSILDKLNPIQPAYAGNQPRSDTLSRINPKDPSGPLLPAPVNGSAATPEQIARPNMSPFDRMRQMHYDSGLNREAMDNPRFEKLGMTQSPEGVPQFARPMDSQFRPSNLGLSNDRMMLPETPYAVNMAGSQEALQYAPPPDQTLQPVQMSQEHMAPFQPNMPTQQVTPLTEVNMPATDMPTVTPETYADPGPTFQMPAEAPIEMPSVGADMGGGGEGMDMSGLMDAFSNLGGGGGGEGGGGGQPQPSGGGADAVASTFSVPDFPSATLGIGQQIAAQGQLANQPVPVQLGGQNMFNVKPIGMAGQQQMQDMSQAPLATKRLFQK